MEEEILPVNGWTTTASAPTSFGLRVLVPMKQHLTLIFGLLDNDRTMKFSSQSVELQAIPAPHLMEDVVHNGECIGLQPDRAQINVWISY